MDPQEYLAFVKGLDAEIAELQAHTKRREEIRERLLLVGEQVDGLRARIDKLRELGAVDRIPDAEKVLYQIEGELEDLNRQMRAVSPNPLPPPSHEEQEVRSRVVALTDEVEREAPRLKGRPADLVEAQFRVWTLKWRTISTESEARGWTRVGGVLRRAYAILREAMKAHADLPYLDGLDPRQKADWRSKLEAAQAELTALIGREPGVRAR